MTAMGAASGLRAWLAARWPELLTPPRRRAMTGVLLVGSVLAAGVLGPSGT